MSPYIGKAAVLLRKRAGHSQGKMAGILGISQVHLSNFENGKATPSVELIEKYSANFDIDLSTLAWTLYGSIDKLPKSVQASALRLQKAWKREFKDFLSESNEIRT